jgi:hypothetical protein
MDMVPSAVIEYKNFLAIDAVSSFAMTIAHSIYEKHPSANIGESQTGNPELGDWLAMYSLLHADLHSTHSHSSFLELVMESGSVTAAPILLPDTTLVDSQDEHFSAAS